MLIWWRFDRILTALLWLVGMESKQAGELDECAVKLRLLLANNLLNGGCKERAERLLQQALQSAEASAGKDSLLVGAVLVELFDFYDRQHRDAEAMLLWRRLCSIIRLHCLRGA
ncbi:MAG: hypothetical protein K2X27_06230 [Candidatus Obscuribacterales bacterium]|nr:hypothetical protein [Candidatus Obscuribacterales bacterium]